VIGGELVQLDQVVDQLDQLDQDGGELVQLDQVVDQLDQDDDNRHRG
jgi:hypothetical protein